MIVEAGRNWILRAARAEGRMGWWVGWVEWPTGSYSSHLNIDTPNRMDDLFQREAMVRAILRSIEALPPNPAVNVPDAGDKTAQRRLLNVKHHEGSGDRRSIDSTIRGSWRHRAPSRTDVAGRTFPVRLRSGWRPKPHSDIDLLVTVTVRLDETTRPLINDLLETSVRRARFSAL